MKNEDEYYDYLILNLVYYKIGALSDKDKRIFKNEDTGLKIW